MTALGAATALMLRLLKAPLHTLRPAMTQRRSKRTQRRGRLPSTGVMLHRVASSRRRRRWQLRSGSSVREQSYDRFHNIGRLTGILASSLRCASHRWAPSRAALDVERKRDPAAVRAIQRAASAGARVEQAKADCSAGEGFAGGRQRKAAHRRLRALTAVLAACVPADTPESVGSFNPRCFSSTDSRTH